MTSTYSPWSSGKQHFAANLAKISAEEKDRQLLRDICATLMRKHNVPWLLDEIADIHNEFAPLGSDEQRIAYELAEVVTRE